MSAKMSNAFKIIALSAGMSENSTTTRLAREIAQGAAAAVGADVEILELRPYARDVAEAMVTGFPSERLERILHSVETADALVVGTPVYNAMPSGLFVEFFDVLPEGALSGTPVAIAATGGTPRHSLVTEQIRPMLVYLHASSRRRPPMPQPRIGVRRALGTTEGKAPRFSRESGGKAGN